MFIGALILIIAKNNKKINVCFIKFSFETTIEVIIHINGNKRSLAKPIIWITTYNKDEKSEKIRLLKSSMYLYHKYRAKTNGIL